MDSLTLMFALLGLIPRQDGDCFGQSLERVGDVNGDGVSEVLLTDSTWDDGAQKIFVGAVWLYDPVKNVAIRRWSGEQANDRFGLGLVIGPDLDGDRFSDFLAWGTREQSGVASVPWQVLSTATGGVLHRGHEAVDSRYRFMSLLAGTTKDERAEARLLSAVVDPMKHEVAVRLSRLGTDEELWARLLPNPRCVIMHSSVLGGDAFDRAGWSVLIVGQSATNAPGPILPKQEDWCSARVRLMNSAGVTVDLDFGADACQQASLAFSAIGGVDCDGDQVRDWIVGNPGSRPYDTRVAAVSGVDGKVLWRVPSSALTANARSLCWTADEDGDGVLDVIVGSPGTIDTDQRLCVISGKSGKSLRTIPRVTEDGDTTTYFGSAVCSVGDVDGDGAHDLVVAAHSPGGWWWNPGLVRVVSGRSGATIHCVTRATIEPLPSGR